MLSLDFLCLLSSAQQDGILAAPALAPPDGVTPNFQHPPNLTIIAKIVTPVLFTIVFALALLRFSSKFVVQRSIHIEDVLCLFGFGTYIGYVWCMYEGVRVIGFYVHQWDVNVQTVLNMLHVFQYFVNFYSMTILFMKAAILLEWMRIFAPPGSSRGAFHVIFVFTLLFYASTQLAGNLTCRPFESTWNKRICGTCFDRTIMDLPVGSMNIASHSCILILPQGIIWNLRLPRRKKMGIALIFMFGILTIVCASLRLVATVNSSYGDDWTYNVAPLALWCLAELTCLFIVFCVPGVPKSLQLFKSWSQNRSSQRSSNNPAKGSTPWPSANSKTPEPIPSQHQPTDNTCAPLQSPMPTHLMAGAQDEKGSTSNFTAVAEGGGGGGSSNPHQYHDVSPSSTHDSKRVIDRSLAQAEHVA